MPPRRSRAKPAGDEPSSTPATKPFAREPQPDWQWGARYDAEYQLQQARKARATQRSRARKRQEKPARTSGDPEKTALRRLFADMARLRQASRRALVHNRRTRGFSWRGGPFAGNHSYRRESFRCMGLISDQHPILKLFVAKLPRAPRLLAGDHKRRVDATDSKLLACDAPYIEDNKTCCGVLRIEVDSILPWEAIAQACRAAGVPLPNIVVGYDNNGQVHRPHLMWLLHNSVPLQHKRNIRFHALYRRVLRGLTKALLGIGADPGGLCNPHRHKNPLSPLWHRRILAEQPYDLGSLKLSVDLTVRPADLNAEAAQRATPPAIPEHPNPEVAAGSNQVFRAVADWARREIGGLRAAGATEQDSAELVADRACQIAADLTGDRHRSEARAIAIGANVARWTWQNQDRRGHRRVTANRAELAQRQAAAGRNTALQRKTRSEELVVAAACRLAEQGHTPTQAAVLQAVRRRGIKSERTIRRHWPAVRAAFANRTNAVALVKKNRPAATRPELQAGGATCPHLRSPSPPAVFLKSHSPARTTSGHGPKF